MTLFPHKALFSACVGLLLATFSFSSAYASVAADFSQDATGGGSIKLGNDTSTCNGTLAGAVKYTGGVFYTCNGSSWAPSSLVNTSTSCSSTNSGAIRYNSAATPPYQYCNGTSWADFNSIVAGADKVPASFSFTNATNQYSGREVYSNTITIAGLDNPSGVGITTGVSGGNSAAFRVNGGPWLTGSYVGNGDTVQLRQLSGYAGNSSYTTTLSVGTSTADWTVTTKSNVCPAGFVLIPGSEGVDGYPDGWCVSKYEMSPYNILDWTQDGTYNGWSFSATTNASTLPVAPKVGQTPITYISRNEAAAACSARLKDSTGAAVNNGKLLTVALWRKLILDMTYNANNWSGGAVGNGYMSRGHAGNQPAGTLPTASDALPAVAGMTNPGGYYWSRTYQTSMGDIVWDIAGNVWEWFDDLHGTDGTTAWTEFTDGTYSFNGTSLEPPNTTWNSNAGVGRIFDADGATVGSTYAALFGGGWDNGATAGPWTSNWNGHSPSSDRNYGIGFRCIAPAQ